MFTKTLNVAELEKVDIGFPGVTMQMMTGDAQGNGLYVMTTLMPGAVIPQHAHSTADEFVYVVLGDFVEAGVTHVSGTAFYAMAGTGHGPHTTKNGCIVLSHFSAPIDFIPAP